MASESVKAQVGVLQSASKIDGSCAGCKDTAHGSSPVEEITLVDIAIGFEVIRGVDGRIFINVSFTVAKSEFVDITGLAVAPEYVGSEKRVKQFRPDGLCTRHAAWKMK